MPGLRRRTYRRPRTSPEPIMRARHFQILSSHLPPWRNGGNPPQGTAGPTLTFLVSVGNPQTDGTEAEIRLQLQRFLTADAGALSGHRAMKRRRHKSIVELR